METRETKNEIGSIKIRLDRLNTKMFNQNKKIDETNKLLKQLIELISHEIKADRIRKSR